MLTHMSYSPELCYQTRTHYYSQKYARCQDQHLTYKISFIALGYSNQGKVTSHSAATMTAAFMKPVVYHQAAPLTLWP